MISCDNSLGPAARISRTTEADFAGTVAKNEFESANGPAGPYAQNNIWVVIPPSRSANAGVVVGKSTPVFLRAGGELTKSTASGIRVGDVIEVWHDPGAGYGAVQAPPNSPVYMGTQIVVNR